MRGLADLDLTQFSTQAGDRSLFLHTKPALLEPADLVLLP